MSNTLVTFKHTFRVTTDKKSTNYGKRRDKIEKSFDIPDWDSLVPREVIPVLSFAMETIFKQKIQENSDNWDYVPNSEEMSFPKLAEYLSQTKERAGKILTNANLDSWLEEFNPVFISAGKIPEFGITIHAIAKAKFIPLVKSPEKVSPVLKFFNENEIVSQFLESSEVSDVGISVFSELISKLEEIESGNVIVKTLSLDSLE